MNTDIVIRLDHGAHRHKPRVQVTINSSLGNDVMIYANDTEAFESAMTIAKAFQKFGKTVAFITK